MKMIHFVDAAGTDEHYVPVSEIKTLKVGDATSVIIYIVSFDPSVAAYGNIDLTCTSGKSDEVASRLAQEIAQGNHDITKVIAGGTGFEDVSAVAWTDGA